MRKGCVRRTLLPSAPQGEVWMGLSLEEGQGRKKVDGEENWAGVGGVGGCLALA